VIRLDAATVLLQWATGGMFFCWFTTRRRMIGLGYGMLLRGVYFCFAIAALLAGLSFGVEPAREIASVGVALGCVVALVVSILRRGAGVSGQSDEFDRRSERVAAMTGIERAGDAIDEQSSVGGSPSSNGREFPPVLDLVPALIGVAGLVVATLVVASDDSLGAADTVVALLRILVGAAFIGAIGDGMLLGHWYLVQPGLPRQLLNEMVTAIMWLWPFEVAVMLLPTGMVSVWTGAVDDGWAGLLGWMWAACAITTIVLIVVTRAALRERYYSAVMAATGLLYLAILTGFGMDIVARAVLDQT
jgi:hypothetical protein